MTKLLVSVRSGAEAQAALFGGADWLDIKEPQHGPLGAALPQVCADVISSVRGNRPVSVALGELMNEPSPPPDNVRLAKCGLSDASCDWKRHWLRWRGALPTNCGAVLVAYADGATVAAPTLNDVLDFAIDVRPDAFLFDTAVKDGRTLLDHLSATHLGELVNQLHTWQVPVALAGSLRAEQIEQLLPLAPDWIAVRGAACRGGRKGRVSSQLVGELARLIQSCRQNRRRVTSVGTVRED